MKAKAETMTFPEMCLRVRADLVKKVHALDELLRNFHEGGLAEDSPAVKDVRAKVKRAYKKRADKSAKGGANSVPRRPIRTSTPKAPSAGAVHAVRKRSCTNQGGTVTRCARTARRRVMKSQRAYGEMKP